MPSRSFRSAPAQNTRSPAPVSTPQRQASGEASRAPNTVSNSSAIRVVSEFARSGRFSVTSRTWSAGSVTAMVVKAWSNGAGSMG